MTVGSLGDFGTARPPIELDFGWFGARIRVHPRASDLSLTEFMSAAEGIEMPDLDDLEGVEDPTPDQLQRMAVAINTMTSVTKALNQFMRDQIHPDDWEEFHRLAKENGQQNADLLAVSKALAAEIAEHVAGFPIGPSAASPHMPRRERRKSGGGSTSQAKRRALASAPADRAQDEPMDLLANRPDLKLALHRRRQAENAEAG